MPLCSLARLISGRALPALMLALPLALPAADEGRVDLPRFPALNPDGTELTFSWGGDLWRAPSEGGDATRLTRHELDDLHSAWSPDGERIVFASMRDGYMNLWSLHRSGTQLTQLTHSDRFLRHPNYTAGRDGEPIITFSGLLEADVYREERPYFIAPDGGEHRRLHEAFGSDPQLSPDGRRIAFTRGGYYHGWSRRHYRGPDAMDVWLHDREAGTFRAITDRDGDDGSARWAGNDTLVFLSDRELETVNLYRIRVDDDGTPAEPERLTAFDERDIQHLDVSRDGSTAVIQVWDTLYRLDLRAAEPSPQPIVLRGAQDDRDDHELRRIDREISEAALSPDGQVMAYIAYGRVYIRHMDQHSPTRAVTRGTHARHKDLAWSPDGVWLYFTNDADGTESIYTARVALTRGEIRRALEEASPGPPGRGAAAPGPTAPPSEDAGPEPPDATGVEPDVPPDDPFAPVVPIPRIDPPAPPEPPADPPAEPVAEPERIPEEELADPTDDERRPDLDPARWHHAVHFTVRPLLQSAHNDREVSPSPDGRSIAFRRDQGDLVVMDLATGETRTLVEGWDSSLHWRWSPDGQYIAYSQNDLNFSANIFIVPVEGSEEPVNITRHPRNDHNPRWSADGRKLTFISNRSGETYDLYRVHLDRELEQMTPRERTNYYRDARKAAEQRKPLPATRRDEAPRTLPEGPAWHELDLEDAWRRVQRVTESPAHQYDNEMTPGGDRYVFNSSGEGLVAMSWDGSERRRLTSIGNVQHLSLTGQRLIYVADGRAGVIGLDGGDHRRPDISDRVRIDRAEQSLQKFREAARVVGEGFYREDMKGLDWPAVVDDYEELIKRARTASEFSDVTNRLLGELAASHMGVSNPGPASALREPSGRLGVETERVERPDGSLGYRVTGVVPESPAALGPMRLREGDVVTRIDLQPFHGRDTLLRRLRGRVGQEVIVSFEREVGGHRAEHQALLTPIDYNELARLKYDAFRQDRRRQVRELSDGRIGYIHIQSMNQASLEEFQGHLYAAAHDKEGLIIDVRNNGGGHTTDRILTSIMAPEHAYTLPRGADPSQRGHYPQDRLDAPRYTQPMSMIANEKSFSNAEILAHAFRTLDRGTLVGQPTYGGVISTGSHTLIDGATVRRPFRGWFLPDGTDMEHHGATPDLRVEQTPEDEVAGRDRQLERAVEELLERLGNQ